MMIVKKEDLQGRGYFVHSEVPEAAGAPWVCLNGLSFMVAESLQPQQGFQKDGCLRI
jgi:hypothetical protein